MMTVTSTTASRRFSRRTTIAASVAALAVVGVGGFQYANAADPGVDIVYVATGADFPDALAGGVLAALEGAPIILLNKDSIPGPSSIELDRLNPRYIRILGGTGVVSANVATQLKAYATANTADEVTRIAGANRFATAAEISKRVPAAASKLPDNQVKVVTGNPALPTRSRPSPPPRSLSRMSAPAPTSGRSGPPPTATT